MAALRALFSQGPPEHLTAPARSLVVSLCSVVLAGSLPPSMRRHALLCSTIVSVALPACIDGTTGNSALLQHCGALRASITADDESVRLVALQCARSLFVLAAKPAARAVGRAYVTIIFPDVVSLLCATSLSSLRTPDTVSEAARTVASPFLSWTAAEEKDAAAQLMMVAVPVLVSAADAKAASLSAVDAILQVGPAHPDAFKAAVAAMPGAMKAKLEEAVRRSAQKGTQSGGAVNRVQASGATRAVAREETAAPTIQLKMDFSNF